MISRMWVSTWLTVLAICAAGPVAAQSRGAFVHSAERVPGSDAYTFGSYGPYQATQQPSALLFGSLPDGRPVTEVVVEQHVLRPGELVPLPRYADGSLAAEDDIFWTAHLWQAFWSLPRLPSVWPASDSQSGDFIRVGFDGRTFMGGSGRLDPYSTPEQLVYRADVMVTVVAMRRATATTVPHASFGELKARYRGEPEPQGVKPSTGR